jgi:WD40 repeat protein
MDHRHYWLLFSDDNVIRLWNPKSGAEVVCPEGHERWIRALCRVPGSPAFGSDDNTIRLWNLETALRSAASKAIPRE